MRFFFSLLCFWFLFFSHAARADATPPQPVFQSETDPDFVLKLSFRVVKTAGSTQVLLVDGQKQRISLDIAANSFALIKHANTKPQQLARVAATFLPTNLLLLTRRGPLLRVALNGHQLLEASAPLHAERIVIHDPAQRLKFAEEPRVQPTEEIYLADDFMTSPETPSHWRTISGVWHVAGAGRPQDAADPFKFVGFAAEEGLGINTDTRWFWSDYQTAVSARVVDDQSAFGIVFNYRSPQDYFGVTWSGIRAKNAGVLVLWHRNGGKIRVLARRSGAARVGQWYRLAVSTFGKEIAVYVDENLALSARDSEVTGGQCGLYVAGEAGAEFDDLRVQSAPSTALIETSTGDPDAAWQARTFSTDRFMTAWGNAASDWESPRDGANNYWYRGRFFDALDIEIAAQLWQAATPAQLQEVFVSDDATDSSQGVRLAFSHQTLSLLIKDQTVASAPLASTSDLGLKLRHNNLQVFESDGTKLLDYHGEIAVRGRVGLRLAAPVATETLARLVQVNAPNLREYRFDAAPVDWSVESGRWQSTNRWACVPNWNFFGGKGTPADEGQPIATVWNKRRFGGDQWIEAFLAPSEGTSDWMHFAFPINLNITFGATDEVLGSGYTLVYRALDATTLLYRAGKIVARSDAIVIPDFRSNPMQVYERMTETWQHVQILREGARIRVWVEVPGPRGHNLDRVQLFDYTDPQPLRGDRLALWTWGINGMAVAKLRVCAAKVAPPVADLLVPRLSTPGQKESWQRHENSINGGSFRADLLKSSTPIEAPAVIRFVYRSTPATALALYAKVNDQLFRADFLGTVSDDGDAIPMGKLRLSGETITERRAEFPLRQALRSFFPSGAIRIEKLFLANLSRDPAQIGGLAVNRKGEVFEYRPLSTEPTSEHIKPRFHLQSADDGGFSEEQMRIALADDFVDPAEYSVALNGRILQWGSTALTWSSARRVITIHPAGAAFTFPDGAAVELTIAKGEAPPVFSQRWTYRTASDKTPPTPPQITTVFGANRINTFENGTDGWQRMGGEQGATLWRDTSTATSGGASLRLYHRQPAGPFAALIRDTPFDARRFPILTFSYRTPLSTKANLVCEVGGKSFEIAFTDDDHTFPLIASIAGVRKDEQWHNAEIDLLGALQRANVGSTVVTKLFFADAGITNTVQDVAWHVDDFRLVPALPSGRESTLRWSANDLSGIAGYSFVFDDQPQTVPDEVLDAGVATPVVTGASYLHVRAQDKAGNWSATTHFRFTNLVLPETSTPLEATAKLPADSVLAAPSVEIQIQNAAQLDIESVRWRVKSGTLQREYSLCDNSDGDEKFTYDARNGVLRWRDAWFSQHANGQSYPLTVELDAGELAGQQRIQRKWEITIDPSRDRTPPLAPFVSYIPADRLGRNDFENGMGDTGIRRSAWVLPDTRAAATGKQCARVVNLIRNDFFAAFLRKDPYSISRYPHLEFDYRFEIPDEAMAARSWQRRGALASEYSPYHLNLVLIVNGEMQIVKFIGGRDGYGTFRDNTIGTIEGVKADGQWHHASIDLGALLRKRYPHSPRIFAEYIGTWAGGPYGYENPQGASLWLDNITISSSQGKSAAFEWRAPEDENGVSGYSFALDQNPDTVPVEKVLTGDTHHEFRDLKPGIWFFHLRARDGAGNWSATTHTRFEMAAGN